MHLDRRSNQQSLPTVNIRHFLAGEVPLDIVVVAHALNEHLVVQMLRKIDRLKTLRSEMSGSNTSRKNRRGGNLRSPCICPSKSHGWSCLGTRWPLNDRRRGSRLIANPSCLHDCNVSDFLRLIMDRWGKREEGRGGPTVSKRKKVFGRRIVGPATSTHPSSEVGNVGGGASTSNFAA